MPDDKKPADNTMAPPPMDPFPTYQTPYPRPPNRDDENPFILFRRFADEQFSSFFSGFPHLFGLSSSGRGDRLKQEVDDLMRQRQEWEEGFRKQFEQEMEEMRQQLEKSKNEAWRSMEDAWRQHSMESSRSDTSDNTPWWTRGRAARCPALNGQEVQKNAEKCPALYDEAGQPRTELDAYNALPRKEHDIPKHVFEAPAHSYTEKNPSRSWFSALGWDGKQKEKYSTSNDDDAGDTKDSAPSEKVVSPPTTYSFWAARRMQPFENTDETIPWLMLSPYSPIYLCNPRQPRLFKVKMQDSEGVPFHISDAKFFDRWYTSVDEKMARHKPWADAFEDLLSLQQTGKMVDRDSWNTWRTPKTWIHDMVSRGSFGSRWGFSEQGMLVKRAIDPKSTAAAVSAPNVEDRCARWRRNRQCRYNKSTEEPTQPGESSEERNPASSLPISAVTEVAAPANNEATQEDFESAAVDSVTQEEGVSHLPTTSSPSTYSYDAAISSSTNSTDVPSDKSVVATLTTIHTRTLPDGSVESRRILKRRFSDGTEETNDEVSVTNIPNSSELGNTEDKATQTLLASESTQSQSFKGEDPRGRQKDAYGSYRDQSLFDEPEKNEELQRQQDQESTGPKRFPRRIPILTAETEPELEHEPQPAPTQQQDGSNNSGRPRRSGGGWFWN
ncbi:hypothetical protein Z517_06397 [Fonsecaea pedrosoi CBS 271.37]|uniref:Uncharacterized protein n=1 Tax=Fonsecaea pedrosoi CBS 271.37 TaxID=1442368 RepID=A0A0D2EZJ5_9EURO|nr:uncharacterized protein Z517_06397 [Fonsecaea pedrosoi CBS 271.37]KIW79782.1 hypothetical protein Z517_06397 [Fonsecaea pedrosoi CBS 271.37]